MAKIYGLFGAMTGKVADVVMVVRNGVQVARKYQPIVSNPSTPAQVAVRARLKLLSQLGAVMAPVIAIPREGIVSARNLFVKSNYPASSFAEGEANIDLNVVQLTRSVLSFPGILATRAAQVINVTLSSAAAGFSRVVYVIFTKAADDTLRYLASRVVEEAGASVNFPTTLPNPTESAVIYAYGVRDNTESARVAFGNLEAPAAETVAQLITSRVLTEVDVTLSETNAITLPAQD